jgi:hypothetical protein
MPAPSSVAVPNVLTDPGYLFVAPLLSTMPNMGESAATAGKFTDSWPAAWLPLGATTDGTKFNYSTKVEPIKVAEFFDPIKYATTDRSGTIAFNLANWTLTNYKTALNGGVSALVAAIGTGATAVYNYEPVSPGNEVRIMVGWESTDNTTRIVIRQSIQGGEVSSSFAKSPSIAAIPCTFNMEMPVGAAAPFKMASTRV